MSETNAIDPPHMSDGEYIQRLEADVDKLQREKDARVYYQDQVYHACLVIDRLLGGTTTTGTLETPESDFKQRCKAVEADVKRLQAWVHDLQSGMYINCVYCGHRYGPREDTPCTMADVLKEHIEQCPEHPLSHAMTEIARLQEIADDKLCRDTYLGRVQTENIRLRKALQVKPGGCKMLSIGDKCDCTLCRQSNEITRLHDQLQSEAHGHKCQTQKVADLEAQLRLMETTADEEVGRLEAIIDRNA